MRKKSLGLVAICMIFLFILGCGNTSVDSSNSNIKQENEVEADEDDKSDDTWSVDEILADMKDVNAQMKAYMLRYKE